MTEKLVVIGGGAAGLMAAGFAAKRGIDVVVLEKMPRPARKLMITGKGRCNVTNNTDVNSLVSAVNKNGKFLYSAFSNFNSFDTMELFESLGVPLKTERGNRVFPVSDKAVDIVDALVKFATEYAKIVTATALSLNIENGEINGVNTDIGTFDADAVIIATGGLSYPGTGSTGDGYRLAESAGHTVKPLRASLVGVECYQGFCTRLQGLSLKNVKLSLIKNGRQKPIFTEQGEMLFTHFGVSGPMVLSASAKIDDLQNSSYTFVIDLKPALDNDTLDSRILRDFAEQSNKDFENALGGLLPSKLIPVVVSLSGIPPKTKVNQISREQRANLVHTLKNLTLDVTALRPVEEAVITAGGVSLSEIDPKTMESKICKGLYFAGEILDVDACTGGFNLQIAFSTGHLAGISV